LSLQGTLYAWAKDSEPQAGSINDIIQGVTASATADALRFFDMDKSYMTRLLRWAAFPLCSAHAGRAATASFTVAR
jgi:hypothetical protein